MKKEICYMILFQLFAIALQGQSLYGGIEIGSKGVKMSVIDVQNVNKGIYELKDFWTENTGIVAGISINGNLFEKDIDSTSQVVLKNYKKLLVDYKVPNGNIFIVASSGVGMAKNIDALVSKIKVFTNKDLDVISASVEAKLLLKGCVPPKSYKNSVLLDIGGGNTKGGYIDVINGGNTFFPISLDIGTVTLTEKIIRKNKVIPLYNFNEISFDYLTTLRRDFAAMYAMQPESLKKENIYLSGGAAWALYTIFNEKAGENNINEMKYEDVLYTKFVIENNFSKVEKTALANKDVQKVLDTYSPKNLISASNLLVIALEDIPDIKNKKIFFAKQGQIAWLVSYIVDNSKGAKPVY